MGATMLRYRSHLSPWITGKLSVQTHPLQNRQKENMHMEVCIKAEKFCTIICRKAAKRAKQKLREKGKQIRSSLRPFYIPSNLFHSLSSSSNVLSVPPLWHLTISPSLPTHFRSPNPYFSYTQLQPHPGMLYSEAICTSVTSRWATAGTNTRAHILVASYERSSCTVISYCKREPVQFLSSDRVQDSFLHNLNAEHIKVKHRLSPSQGIIPCTERSLASWKPKVIFSSDHFQYIWRSIEIRSTSLYKWLSGR